MNDNFNDRLLDASLQEYSRVSPPEEFASRVLAKAAAPRPARLAWLGWLAIPTAAAALACSVVMIRPAPSAPPAVVAFHACPVVRHVAVRRITARPPSSPAPFHTLTGVELASMSLPAELFAKQEEKPITEIVIPELTVAPLEIPTIPEIEGVKQP